MRRELVSQREQRPSDGRRVLTLPARSQRRARRFLLRERLAQGPRDRAEPIRQPRRLRERAPREVRDHVAAPARQHDAPRQRRPRQRLSLRQDAHQHGADRRVVHHAARLGQRRQQPGQRQHRGPQRLDTPEGRLLGRRLPRPHPRIERFSFHGRTDLRPTHRPRQEEGTDRIVVEHRDGVIIDRVEPVEDRVELHAPDRGPPGFAREVVRHGISDRHGREIPARDHARKGRRRPVRATSTPRECGSRTGRDPHARHHVSRPERGRARRVESGRDRCGTRVDAHGAAPATRAGARVA